MEPLKIRYFAVGEYGSETQRPHYHVILFNYPSCIYGISRYSKYRTNCCPNCDLIRDTWQHGQVLLGTVDPESIQYTAGYTVKKMTSMDDIRLNGRHPEFARMSCKPGIGYSALHDVADTLLKFNLENEMEDVPSSLQHGKKKLPLDQYMRRNLRELIGRDKKAPESTIQKSQETMQKLLADAQKDVNDGTLSKEFVAQAAYSKFLEQSDQKERRNTAWQKMRNRSRKL